MIKKKHVLVKNVTKVYKTIEKKKLPLHFIAARDWGKIPSHLPELTLLEQLAISKSMAFVNVIKLKSAQGVSQNAIQGHCIALPIDSTDGLTQNLPRIDLAKYVGVSFIDQGTNWPLVKKLSQDADYSPLKIDLQKCLQWLKYLKETNIYYKDIIIPTTKEKQREKKSNFQKKLNYEENVKKTCGKVRLDANGR